MGQEQMRQALYLLVRAIDGCDDPQTLVALTAARDSLWGCGSYLYGWIHWWDDFNDDGRADRRCPLLP